VFDVAQNEFNDTQIVC